MYRYRYLCKRKLMGVIASLLLLLTLPAPENTSAMPQVDSFVTHDWVKLNNGDEVGRYFRKNDHIYVHINPFLTEMANGADPKTFKVIREGIGEWGADKDSVYSQWNTLENSDPQTFQFIDSLECTAFSSRRLAMGGG